MRLHQQDEHISKHKVFLDSDNLPKISVLMDKVRSSRNVVFILTRGFLTRPWCLLELATAICESKTLIPVRLMNASRGFDFQQARNCVHNLETELAATHPGAIDAIRKEGFTVDEVQAAIAILLDIVAVELNISLPEGVVNAQYQEIFNKFEL